MKVKQSFEFSFKTNTKRDGKSRNDRVKSIDSHLTRQANSAYRARKQQLREELA